MLVKLQNKILLPFKPLTFDEKRHIYYWYGRKVPKSVSAKVHEHEVPFNELQKLKDGRTLIEASADKQSRLQGREVTVHELRHTWQTLAKTGCELGTETHDYMEYYNGTKTPDTPQKKAGVKFLRWLLSETYIPNPTKFDKEGKIIKVRRYEIIARELRMYSIMWKFAGTADIIVADKMTRTIVIIDYKTNKDLWKTYGYLKAPFDYLESHPYNKYQLQLSYYQIIFEEMTGIKVSNRILAYLKADEEFVAYNLEDFTQDLRGTLFNKRVIYN